MDNKNYTFYKIESCNMCNAKSEKFKTIGQRLNCSQGLNPKNKIGISVSVIKCKNCNLIFSSPRPEPYSINDHYKVDPNKYWKDEYFVINENYFSYEINIAKKFLKSTKFPKALDIGGGIGKAHVSLTKNGFDTTSIEPSETFRNVALNKYNISAEKFLLCSIENAKIKKESFDFITFGAVLEHLNDPSKSINKAMTWLKPGGVIQIEVPSSNHLIAKLYNLFFKLRGTNYVTNLSPMHEPFHMYEFGLRSFKKHAKNNNYEIAKYQYFVCNIYNIPKIFHPILRYIMKKTNTGMQLSIWLRKI